MSCSSVLMNYLKADMAFSPVECVRVLHLNSRNMLIRDEMIARGTVDAVAIYSREIIARALELGSSALILAHNHPGGDPSPSAEDVRLTKGLVIAAGAFDIQVHDHVIVATEGFSSMRQMRLL